jgi:hypothetical protein
MIEAKIIERNSLAERRKWLWIENSKLPLLPDY